MGTGIGDKAFGADMKQAAEGKARRREALSRRTEDYATKRRYAPGSDSSGPSSVMEDDNNPWNLTMQSAEEGFNTNDKEGVKKGGGAIKPPRPGKKFGDGRDVLGTGYPAPNYPDEPKSSPAFTSPEDYPMAPTTSFGRPPGREDSLRPPRRSFGRPPEREDSLRPPGREDQRIELNEFLRGRPDRKPPAEIMDTMRRERSEQWQRKLNDMRRQRATGGIPRDQITEIRPELIDRQRVGSPGREDQPRAPFGGNPQQEWPGNFPGKGGNFKAFLDKLSLMRGGSK